MPDGARPEQILETIYLRNETESAPLRPRRFEITSMFTGCIVHLSGHGWWLCEPVGFRPAPFEPVILEGKTLYCGEVIENFPRLVRVPPTPAGRGLVGIDGELFLSRRGVSHTLEGTFGETSIEVHPTASRDGWEVLAIRRGAGLAPRKTVRAATLWGALAVAAQIASGSLQRPLVPARVIAALMYRGTPIAPTERIPDRIVCPCTSTPSGTRCARRRTIAPCTDSRRDCREPRMTWSTPRPSRSGPPPGWESTSRIGVAASTSASGASPTSRAPSGSPRPPSRSNAGC